MPKTGRHTKKSPLTVRSHRFKFTSPLETKIYNMPKETNACFSCHKDKSLDELQDSINRWGCKTGKIWTLISSFYLKTREIGALKEPLNFLILW